MSDNVNIKLRREGDIFGVVWSLTERWSATGADGRWAIVQVDPDGAILLMRGNGANIETTFERDVMSAMRTGALWCREGRYADR